MNTKVTVPKLLLLLKGTVKAISQASKHYAHVNHANTEHTSVQDSVFYS